MSNWTAEFLAQYNPATARVNDQVLREFSLVTGKPVWDATQDDVISYSLAISSGGKLTQKRKLSTLSAFFKYLMRRGLASENPTVAVRSPKTDRAKTIQWLSEDEVDVLLSRTHDPMARAVLYAGLSGLRVSEIQGLNVEQFRDGRLWNVEGKGGKVRTIPLTEDAAGAITEYVGNRKSGPMFYHRVRRDRVTVRTLQNIVYRATESALGRRINPHALRHTFATMCARADIPVLKMAWLLGHSNPAVTEIYIHLAADDLVDEVNKLNKKRESRKPNLRLVYSKPA